MVEKRIRNKFLVFFFLLLTTFSLFFFRLLDVEIIRGEEFFELSEENRYFNKRNKAERAIFLDRYGDPLVKNQKQYLRLLEPDQLYSDKELLDKEEALKFLATDSAQISYDFSRNYLYGEALASSLGYLSSVTAEDLDRNENIALDERLGRMGLERYFDEVLRSKAAHQKFEVNALGEKQKLVEYQEAVYGQNIETSLDPYLSTVAYQALDGKKGAVIIMDAETGNLLTLVSSPSYDPNVFEANFLDKLADPKSRVISENGQKISDYLSDERQLFFNRSISGAYPPGSVFKLVTALGALEEEALDANTVVEDEGVLRVGDWEYANWYFTQYGRTEGSVDLVKAIARSNDIYFYKAAEWLGPAKLAQYSKLLSYGEKIGVELGGEVTGLVPDPSWKEEVLGESWYLGNTYHFGIGQGDLLVTPLQVAQMTQAIANHGSLCPASILDTNNHACRDLSLKEENLNLVLEGMRAACSSGGTAYPLFPYNQEKELELGIMRSDGEIGDTNFEIGEEINKGIMVCKTGTAEFGGVDENGYRKTHAWLTSIVGVDFSSREDVDQEGFENDDLKDRWLEEVEGGNNFPKKLVITVLVESDEEKPYREGSDDAAPVVAKILEWMGV